MHGNFALARLFAMVKEVAHLGRNTKTHGTPRTSTTNATAGQPEPSDDELFRSAVAGARPLQRRERVAAADPRSTVPNRSDVPKSRLIVERDGERVEGRAPGVSRTQLAPLRRGQRRPEARLDLHHCTTDVARHRLCQFIDQSQRAAHACVLVVPGRGLHSSDGPVIKQRVIEWLSAGVLAPKVRAFCSARPADGGLGALYILLHQ